ncbi:MAG TPA: membrane protein insertion efficiency factor YidD [Bacteroidia bacterium]|nr:membrane protein insertion efficiency factor YidD [Sphingobacteriales bacterium]HPD64341.1 membrane protein insertion efficiency factor YidD [Bacteroidia bacterium]HRU69174.1 membrane protein insertion efficiency factor YidD [Bacteroidia bacterium]
MKVFIVILMCVSVFQLKAQTLEELKILEKTTEHDDRPYYLKFVRNQGKTGDKIVSAMFLFYKNFISSQDFVSCSFYPSCSEYALLVLKKQNIFTGTMNFFDRLTRCHTFTPQQYHIHPEYHLQIDLPKNARYEDL